MYDPKSGHADEFIDHQEILDTLEYADKNKNNEAMIRFFGQSSFLLPPRLSGSCFISCDVQK